MNTIFKQKLEMSLTGLSKLNKKTKKGGKHENKHVSVWEKYIHIVEKSSNSGNYSPGYRISSGLKNSN